MCCLISVCIGLADLVNLVLAAVFAIDCAELIATVLLEEKSRNLPRVCCFLVEDEGEGVCCSRSVSAKSEAASQTSLERIGVDKIRVS